MTPWSRVHLAAGERRRRSTRSQNLWVSSLLALGTSRIDGYPHLNFHFKITDEDARTLGEHNVFVITTFYALNAFSGRVYRDHPGYLDD